MKKATQRSGTGDLVTIRDFLRYGVSRFTVAGLSYGHGTSNAFDEAAFLILETLHLPIDSLEPFLDARLTASERKIVAAIIERRIKTRKPAAYLTGRAYIQGIGFQVDERVIVPRSYIGEILLSDLVGGEGFALIEDPSMVTSVLDLCTGSAALAIIAAMRFPNAKVDAVEVSAPALEVAKANVGEHGLQSRVNLIKGDLFAPLGKNRYDLILANPPYVDAEEMAVLPPEYRHEPKIALAGGEDGLSLVRRILALAADHLNEGGALLCEIGTGRDALEAEYPDTEFFFVETEESSGEVFWVPRQTLAAIAPIRVPSPRKRR